ncbi:MAG: hypothetical protein QUS14_13405 [Pyrinomonadaceae bacterium]|nr:hypothetical protein [Pyrinomonadaceae bacterium]
MNVLLRQVQFLLIACLVAIGTIACRQEQHVETAPPASNISQDLSDVSEVQLARGGRALVKKSGWHIPTMQSDLTKPTESKGLKAKTIDGIEVSVDSTRYTPVFGRMLVPGDATAAIQIGELNVQFVSEYRKDSRPFAYSFAVNRIFIDREANSVTGSERVVTYYVIYDEDGDGIFETLVIPDKDFFHTLRPHVPKWAARSKT